MSIHITIYDGATPMLDQIAQASYGAALDILDRAGSKIRKSSREAFHTSEAHYWHTKYVNGKRRIYRGNTPAVFGQRRSAAKQGAVASPSSVANHISSFLMEKHLTMVVGGVHPTFRATIWRDGKAVGTNAPTKKVGSASYQIIKKLNDGGTYASLDPEYKRLLRRRQMRGFRNAVYRPRKFMERGREMAMGAVTELMTSKLEAMIHRQVNRATVKTKVWAS